MIEHSWHGHYFLGKFSGNVTVEHIFRAMKGFYRDDRSEAAQAIVIDLSQVETIPYQSELIRDIVRIDQLHSHLQTNLKFAFVNGNENTQKFIDAYLEKASVIKWRYACFEELPLANMWVCTTDF